jgi:N-acetylneuraminic acid mutarotase
VAAVGGRLMIAGGTSGVTPQRAILAFDPATRRVTTVGRLPAALTHASAASLGGALYVVGGRSGSSGGQTTAILAVDPSTGAVRRVGRLPVALSDTSAVPIGREVLLLGGRDASGRARDDAYGIAPAP